VGMAPNFVFLRKVSGAGAVPVFLEPCCATARAADAGPGFAVDGGEGGAAAARWASARPDRSRAMLLKVSADNIYAGLSACWSVCCYCWSVLLLLLVSVVGRCVVGQCCWSVLLVSVVADQCCSRSVLLVGALSNKPKNDAENCPNWLPSSRDLLKPRPPLQVCVAMSKLKPGLA